MVRRDLAGQSAASREPFEQAIEWPTALPLLKSPMTRLVRGIPQRQIGPRGAGAEHPEDPVQNCPRIGPRSPASIGTATPTKGRMEKGPLGVGQVPAARHDDATRSVVTRLLRIL